jgi:hypothetical protein
MNKSATKCNETLSKWCKNKHGASKIMDTFETYQCFQNQKLVLWPCLNHRLDEYQPTRARNHTSHPCRDNSDSGAEQRLPLGFSQGSQRQRQTEVSDRTFCYLAVEHPHDPMPVLFISPDHRGGRFIVVNL